MRLVRKILCSRTKKFNFRLKVTKKKRKKRLKFSRVISRQVIFLSLKINNNKLQVLKRKLLRLHATQLTRYLMMSSGKSQTSWSTFCLVRFNKICRQSLVNLKGSSNSRSLLTILSLIYLVSRIRQKLVQKSLSTIDPSMNYQSKGWSGASVQSN